MNEWKIKKCNVEDTEKSEGHILMNGSKKVKSGSGSHQSVGSENAFPCWVVAADTEATSSADSVISHVAQQVNPVMAA